MLLTILAAIAAIIAIIYFISEAEWLSEVFIMSIASVFGIAIVWFVISLILGYSLPRTIKYENVPIVALQDGSQSSGSFFLGTGVVEGKPVYAFYEKSGDGFKLTQVNAKDVVVYQSDVKPYVVRAAGCEGAWWSWITECLYDDDEVTKIYTPAGTIKENFVLDAK